MLSDLLKAHTAKKHRAMARTLAPSSSPSLLPTVLVARHLVTTASLYLPDVELFFQNNGKQFCEETECKGLEIRLPGHGASQLRAKLFPYLPWDTIIPHLPLLVKMTEWHKTPQA